MGFIWKAKHGLSKHGIKKTKVGLILGRRTKREGKGEEKKKGRRWRSQDQASQGMETTLDMNSIMDHMDFVWNLDFRYRTTKFEYESLVLYGIILPKPRVC